MLPNIDPKRIEDVQKLYGKLSCLDPTKLAIIDARIDQMLLDQQEIRALRSQLELAHALLAKQKPA